MNISTAFETGRIDARRLSVAFGGAAIVVLLAVAVIAVVLSDSSANTADASAPSLQPAFDATAVSNGRNGAPLVLVSGEPMFPVPRSGIYSDWLDAPVVAQQIPVQSVTTRGFWMGSNETQRVFVTVPASAIEKGSLNLDRLEAGGLVNVSGYMRALPDNLRPLALDDSSRRQLERGGALLEANSVRSS